MCECLEDRDGKYHCDPCLDVMRMKGDVMVAWEDDDGAYIFTNPAKNTNRLPQYDVSEEGKP